MPYSMFFSEVLKEADMQKYRNQSSGLNFNPGLTPLRKKTVQTLIVNQHVAGWQWLQADDKLETDQQQDCNMLNACLLDQQVTGLPQACTCTHTCDKLVAVNS